MTENPESPDRRKAEDRDPLARRARIVRRLTWFNALVLPMVWVLFIVGLSINTDFFKTNRFGVEYLISLLLFLGVLAIPVTTIVALVLNRRIKWKPATWISLTVLVLWLVFIAASLRQ